MAYANDVVPELLTKVEKEFNKRHKDSKALKALNAKLKDGTATYHDANLYAIEVGEMLKDAYKKITGDDLPAGRMYYNIAERVIGTTIEEKFNLVTEMAEKVQKALNKGAGIGLAAIKPEIDPDREQGILNRLAEAESFDNIAWILGEPVVEFMLNAVDESIRLNAEFQWKSGMDAKIVRRMESTPITTYTKKVKGKVYGPYEQTQPMPCAFCMERAGTYDYYEVMDSHNEVFRRHAHCRCTVEYDPGNGKVQNAHDKTWQSINKREIADRIKRVTSMINPMT